MAKFDFDLFVIGAGSGGVRAARMAAGLGARVAVAENRDLGGTCVNVGCVPKKLFVYASHYSEDFEDARAYGWRSTRPEFEWSTLRDNKDAEIRRLNGVYQDLLEKAGVEIIRDTATFTGPHALDVGGRPVSAEKILVATGSWPSVGDIPGREFIITSNEAFHLERFPHHVVIVGGGYIAVEFAGIFNGLGAEVVQLYRGPLFLRGFDDDLRSFVHTELTKKGIDVRMQRTVEAIEGRPGDLTVHLNDGTRIRTELVMCAIGRYANTQHLNLQAAGVQTRPDGSIPVDVHYRSNVPHILAIGDVIGRLQLTPVAIAEAMALVQTHFGGRATELDYEFIPTAVFCQPNMGTVGPTENQARQRYGSLDIYESSFRPMKHTMTGGTERTYMKLVVAAESDRVVGVHMVGPEAGEIIQGMAVAVKAGATKATFDATVGIHPTAAEEFVTMREPSR